jgi:hypothetical protein
VALSQDPQQQWAYINDGSNNRIWILRRETLETVGSFASYGRNGGQVISAHSMAVDQQGNIYIGETRGRRALVTLEAGRRDGNRGQDARGTSAARRPARPRAQVRRSISRG